MSTMGTWLRPGMALAGAAALLAGAAALLAQPAAAAGAVPGTAPAAAARSVMIVLDTNNSFGASGLDAEQSAAQAYVAKLPSDVRVGLITFSDAAQSVLTPTANRGRFRAAVSAVQLSAGVTSAGITAALSKAQSVLHQIGAPRGGRLLVLSDAEVLTGPVHVPAIPTDVAYWYYESDDIISTLRPLAGLSGGHAVPGARAAALAAAFPALPAPTGTAAASAPAAPAPAANGLGLPVLLTVVFVAIMAVMLAVLGGLRSGDRAKDLMAQIERYGPRHAPAVSSAASQGKVADAAMGWAQRALRAGNAEPRLAQRLDLAGSVRKPAEWALLGFCATIALIAVLTLLTNLLIAIPVGGLAGWLGMHFLLNIRIARRRRAFSDQLPDVLQLVAGSLQAGFSLPQALDGVVREGSQPAAGEFSRALAEARIGAELETSLEGVAGRMSSVDLAWTVMAIRIQREVGGNLAEVLRNTVATMRERAFLRRHVKALSAEGRLSAYILTGLPLAVTAWMLFTARSYMQPLYTTLLGWFMIGGALALFAAGVFWLRALIQVEA